MSKRHASIHAAILGLSTLLGSALVSQPAQAIQAGPDEIYSITPCRILDTRIAVGVFGGRLAPNEELSIQTWGSIIISQGGSGTQCPDIPEDATGLFITVQAVNPAGSENFLGVRPFNTEERSTAILYSPNAGTTANSQFVATCYGQWYYGAFGSLPNPCRSFNLTFNNGPNGTVDVVVDVTGFTRDDPS
jgi:hypothetical protein